MRKLTSVVLASSLLVGACTGLPVNPPVTPVPPANTPPNTPPPSPLDVDVAQGCALYNTLAFLVPFAVNLASKGQLTATQQLYLADAQSVLAAACNPSNTTIMMRAAAAAQALVAAIWQTPTPTNLPPP